MIQMKRRNFIKKTSGVVLVAVSGSEMVVATDGDLRERAKEVTARNQGVEQDALEVVNEGLSTFEILDEKYYEAKVRNTNDRMMYPVMLDVSMSPVDQYEVREAERAAWAEKYGPFTPNLYEVLQRKDGDDEISAQIWTKLNRSEIWDRNVNEDGIDREQYSTEVRRRVKERLDALEEKMERFDSISVGPRDELLPMAHVHGAVRDVEAIAELPVIEKVAPPRPDYVPALDTAAQVHETDTSSFDGTGYKIGMVENRVPDGSYINLVDTYSSNPDTADHPTIVSYCMASYDNLEGVASNADVYAAGYANTSDGKGKIIQWFLNNGVYRINQSAYFSGGTTIESSDVKNDQYMYDHNFVHTICAGNEGGEVVGSPGRGFNCVSVAAIKDNETGYLSDDSYADFSDYKDPDSRFDGHTKPDASAVGNAIDLPNGNQGSGTSLSAPMVNGLFLLMEKLGDDDDDFHNIRQDPEVLKAILYASSDYHVTSTNSDGISNKEGAGTIDAEDAWTMIASDPKNYKDALIYESDDHITVDIDIVNSDTKHRIAAVWLTNPSNKNIAGNPDAESDIDLDIGVYDPDGNSLGGSFNYARSWEHTTFTSNGTGTYTLQIDNYRWEAAESSRPVGVAWQPVTPTS